MQSLSKLYVLPCKIFPVYPTYYLPANCPKFPRHIRHSAKSLHSFISGSVSRQLCQKTFLHYVKNNTNHCITYESGFKVITEITPRAQTERVEEMKENFRYFLRDRKVKVEEEIEREKERLAEENGLNNLEMSIKKAKNCFGPALVCTNCESRGSSRKPMIECSR